MWQQSDAYLIKSCPFSRKFNEKHFIRNTLKKRILENRCLFPPPPPSVSRIACSAPPPPFFPKFLNFRISGHAFDANKPVFFASSFNFKLSSGFSVKCIFWFQKFHKVVRNRAQFLCSLWHCRAMCNNAPSSMPSKTAVKLSWREFHTNQFWLFLFWVPFFICFLLPNTACTAHGEEWGRLFTELIWYLLWSAAKIPCTKR